MSEIKAWKILSREEAFKKFSRIIEKVIFQLPDGSEADFYITKANPAVCTLGLTQDNKVILVRQYRPGPDEILYELPGGYIDPGEEPHVAAEREFLEETGYKGNFQFIGTCLDDAYSTMERSCFVAKDCHKVGEPQNSAREQTEVRLCSLKDFRKMLRSGKMTDIEVGYLGLDYLKLL